MRLGFDDFVQSPQAFSKARPGPNCQVSIPMYPKAFVDVTGPRDLERMSQLPDSSPSLISATRVSSSPKTFGARSCSYCTHKQSSGILTRLEQCVAVLVLDDTLGHIERTIFFHNQNVEPRYIHGNYIVIGGGGCH